ncbi:MAG: glycosyltransferase [Eubacteriales bacterium]
MKILFINSVCGIGSTGRIVVGLAEQYMSEGHICKISYGRAAAPDKYNLISYRIGTELQVKKNALKARVLDNEAFNARKETKKFIKWANNYDPDVLWLHNLHGYYINIDLLFNWIKSRPQMQVNWTLHDCWAFTGHCTHFSVARCNKWKHQCGDCPQKTEYPKSYLKDNSATNYQMKMKAFTGVDNMTIITPSKWLADLVKKSFLKEYPIKVVHNEIDRDVFKPTPGCFREKHNLVNKHVILGVASVWGKRKGLDDFIKLSAMLDDSCRIVLVGLSKKQIKQLPNQIIGIQRTNSTGELAEIYTAADVFVNTSKEETFGMTTIEALACGTQVIVYKDTACEEIANEYGGIVVEQNLEELKDAVLKLLSKNYENNS